MTEPVADISMGDDDTIRGPLPGDCGTRVSVFCDGVRWAGVPVATDDAGRSTFACQLEPLPEPRKTAVEVRDAAGERVLSRSVMQRTRRTNEYGLAAHDVYRLGHPPLTALPWVGFDGVRLTIGGGHLPPRGDPSSLGVRFDSPGVVHTFTYPLRSPGWEDVYWYWPNAANSNLLLAIDLPASPSEADPFHFEFVETRDGDARKLSDVWIPSDLRAFLNFTSDVSRIDRVLKGNDPFSIVLPSYLHFRYLEEQFARFGIVDGAGIRLLDWGCGVGRLSAHFIRTWRQAEIRGTDIDAANVDWCRTSLGRERFEVAPLWPPTGYPAASFDGVFGVSVMTHLTAEAQAAWLRELARVLKPGGIALLTFAGTAGTAVGSRWRSASWWAAYSARGFDAETHDRALDGFIDDPDYYRHTGQTRANVRATWSAHFDVLEMIDAAFGNQDLAVLRRR